MPARRAEREIRAELELAVGQRKADANAASAAFLFVGNGQAIAPGEDRARSR
jgi:hypothetical protein